MHSFRNKRVSCTRFRSRSSSGSPHEIDSARTEKRAGRSEPVRTEQREQVRATGAAARTAAPGVKQAAIQSLGAAMQQ